MTDQTASNLPDLPVSRATRPPKRRGLFFLAILLPILVLGVLAGLTYDQIRREKQTEALLQALQHEKLDTKQIVRLLDQGADPNITTGQTSLPHRTFYQEMLALLRGERRTETGTPLLKQSAGMEDTSLLRALLRHGAKPDMRGDDSEMRLLWAGNKTPLMIAVMLGRAEAVKELLAAGANPDLIDADGRTALSYAVSILSTINASEEYTKSDTRVMPPKEAFGMLWMRGEEFFSKRYEKGPIVDKDAAEKELTERLIKETRQIVQALLMARADPNRKDKQGMRPMAYIIYPRHNVALIAQLKQAGAKD